MIDVKPLVLKLSNYMNFFYVLLVNTFFLEIIKLSAHVAFSALPD